MTDKHCINLMSLICEKYIEEADPYRKNAEKFPIKEKFDSGAKKFSLAKMQAAVLGLCAVISLALVLPTILAKNIDTGDTSTNSASQVGNNSSGQSISAAILESGFVLYGYEEIPSDLCAYKSDQNEYDINDVTLTFYFGGIFGGEAWKNNIDEYRKENENIEKIDLCFSTEEEQIFIVKKTEDFYVSAKYAVNVNIQKDKTWLCTFNHFERLTIPKESFTKESGVVYFSTRGINLNEYNAAYRILGSIPIYYQKVGQKIILSDKSFDNNL